MTEGDSDPSIRFHNFGVPAGFILAGALLGGGVAYFPNTQTQEVQQCSASDVELLRREIQNVSDFSAFRHAEQTRQIERNTSDIKRIDQNGPAVGNRDYARRLDALENHEH